MDWRRCIRGDRRQIRTVYVLVIIKSVYPDDAMRQYGFECNIYDKCCRRFLNEGYRRDVKTRLVELGDLHG